MQLREALQQMLSGNSGRSCKYVAEYCHDIAQTYLRFKLNKGEDYLLKVSLDREHLAWDCIAGLFERDSEDQYLVFKDYFEDYNLELLDDSEVEIALRRLVFSKVNDGIFRNFGSFDPSLRKIIRNVKLAVQDCERMELDQSNGEKYVQLEDLEDSSLPTIPPEFLEVRLFYRIKPNMTIPDVITQVCNILGQQSEYRDAIEVTQLAVSIRKVYARMNDYARQEEDNFQKLFYEDELEMLIEKSIDSRKQDLNSSYVETDKLEQKLFSTYFQTVEEVLKDTFVEDNPNADTYFEHLKECKPDITKEEYREDHRQYLEYFIQKTRDDLIHNLKKEYEYSANEVN